MLDVKNLRKDKTNYRVVSRETEHAVLMSSLSYSVYGAEQLCNADHLMGSRVSLCLSILDIGWGPCCIVDLTCLEHVM